MRIPTLTEAYIREDEEQRSLRGQRDERAEEYQLPNIENFLPPDRRRAVPYVGQNSVTIYRGVSDDDPGSTIRPGDWVALIKKYAAQHGGGRVISMKVPAADVVWAGTDENEWWYVPR